MRSDARRPSLVLALSLSCLVACAEKHGGGGPPGGGFTPPPTPVETATVSPQIVRDLFRAVGSVEARAAVHVAPEIDGRIVSLPFEEGSRVSKGQVLARLDDVQVRAELARAQSVLAHARGEAARARTLSEQEILAVQERDAKQADLGMAEAEADVERARLEKTIIQAPFAGVIGIRRVSPGAWVRAGDVITDLAAIDTVKIAFAAPERLLGRLQRGSKVTVSTPAFPGMSFDGEVSVIDPVIDTATRNARVVAVAANPEGRLLPGMSATVDVLLAERLDALTVPNEAIFVEGTQSLLYVVTPEGTVRRQPVELGTRLADVVEVLSGLSDGDRVVSAGHQKLYEGASVAAVDGSAASAGAPAGAAGP